MAYRVNIRVSTRGEFDAHYSVWLINPNDPDDEIDAIYDTDSLSDAVSFCRRRGYTIVERPDHD
jgi:hypothetical protein